MVDVGYIPPSIAPGGAASVSTVNATSTTDATALGTAAVVDNGGLSVAKNVIFGQGMAQTAQSVASAAGTTTLVQSSPSELIITGATTQTVQLPAANVFGAGVGAVYVIKNESTGNVTVQRAGADTIFSTVSGTTITLTTGQCCRLMSDGVSKWSSMIG